LTNDIQLNTLRKEILKVTLEIVDLVSQRNALAKQIAREKIRTGASLINLAVERNLRRIVAERCTEIGSEPDVGQRLLNFLIAEAIHVQKGSLEPPIAVSAHDIFVRAKNMEQAGQDVIHLEIGEPDFGPPKSVKGAISDAISLGHTHYTQSVGIPALRQKIATQAGQRYQRKVAPEEVIVTAGGRYAFFLGIVALIQPGEEVLIIDPSYPAYSNCVREVGGRPIHISTSMENGWVLEMEAVQDHISPSTRLLILNSPSNPTGKVLEESVVRDLVALANENDISLISDEVYSDFSYTPHTSVLQYPDSKQITIKSFSKLYGMTGFRLGYAITDSSTVERMARIQNLHLTSVSEFIQYAGLAALDSVNDANRNIATIQDRLQTVKGHLIRLPFSFSGPDGGLYIFLRMKSGDMNGREVADRLLSECAVGVMPGIVYGRQYDPFFRISVCQPEDRLVEAMERIEEVLG
jgi:aspartate aminotransferase